MAARGFLGPRTLDEISMLTTTQIEYLCKIGLITPTIENGIVLYISENLPDCVIYAKYEEFKQQMGLTDINLHWLTTKNAFMAGGAVLNWALSENMNEDFDFFFSDNDCAGRFELVVKNYFSFCRTTHCATTYMKDATIIQLVGVEGAHYSFFGCPREVINRFDIDLCKFAVDNEFVYTTRYAIKDMISKSLHYKEDCQIKYLNQTSSQRLFKYSRKGFYATDKNFGRI